MEKTEAEEEKDGGHRVFAVIFSKVNTLSTIFALNTLLICSWTFFWLLSAVFGLSTFFSDVIFQRQRRIGRCFFDPDLFGQYFIKRIGLFLRRACRCSASDAIPHLNEF